MAKNSQKEITNLELLAYMKGNFAIKDDLKGFATKDDLKVFATKDDVKHEIEALRAEMATKTDLKHLETTIIEGVNDLIQVQSDNIDERFDDSHKQMRHIQTAFEDTVRVPSLDKLSKRVAVLEGKRKFPRPKLELN